MLPLGLAVIDQNQDKKIALPLLQRIAYGCSIGCGTWSCPIDGTCLNECRCAFMLPVATPPNAIVFGTGKIPIAYMAREGLVLNFIGIFVITTVCYFLVP